ncbi:TIGR03619 family F420-dependent LLM class oxidoreductase [Rhizorhabdus dicambivorans]|nr:TIGR03619 family F420-dependent LLM class oxidoreductase [Rhizorhabdus dicambivorans]
MATAKTKFGIQTYDYPPDQLLALAKAADRLGFEGLWMGEHYVNPSSFQSAHPGHTERSEVTEDDILGPHVTLYDPIAFLCAVAGATQHLKIGTAIVIVPLMHPLLLARATVTAWHVSGGRFRLGTGAGWLKEEFDILGVPFNERGSRLDEAIDIMQKAWAGGYFEHSGKHFQFECSQQVTKDPTPIPLVIGGNTGPALRRVARVADMWMNSAMISLEEALRLRDTIEAERRALGKNEPLSYILRPESPDVETVGSFLAEGFDHIVLWGPHLWPKGGPLSIAEKEAKLAAFAAEMGITPR